MINWNKFAEMNGMSVEDFKQELMITTMSMMLNEMDKNNSAEMIFRVDNNILQCIKAKVEDQMSELANAINNVAVAIVFLAFTNIWRSQMNRILLESKWAQLPFDGFQILHRDSPIRVWESHKKYNKNDANNYMERLKNKHGSCIYNITWDALDD